MGVWEGQCRCVFLHLSTDIVSQGLLILRSHALPLSSSFQVAREGAEGPSISLQTLPHASLSAASTLCALSEQLVSFPRNCLSTAWGWGQHWESRGSGHRFSNHPCFSTLYLTEVLCGVWDYWGLQVTVTHTSRLPLLRLSSPFKAYLKSFIVHLIMSFLQ